MVPQPRTITLTDNRVVSLYEYGDPDGRPVLTFHGVPASGAGFAWADEPARARGLWIIAPDRPGVGLSTRADGGFTIASEAGRMDRLCEVLGIDRFAVWGYSGGGPYALACAALLGDRITAVAVAAGMGQLGEWAEVADFAKTDRQFLELSAKHPAVARLLMGVTGRLARWSPKTAMKSFEGDLSEADRAAVATLGEPKEAMALFTQAFLRGAGGVIDDYRAINGPWGVDLATITAPVSIWQGDADDMVPLRHAQALADRLPAAELHVWPGEGHLGTITHVEDILDWVGDRVAIGALPPLDRDRQVVFALHAAWAWLALLRLAPNESAVPTGLRHQVRAVATPIRPDDPALDDLEFGVAGAIEALDEEPEDLGFYAFGALVAVEYGLRARRSTDPSDAVAGCASRVTELAGFLDEELPGHSLLALQADAHAAAMSVLAEATIVDDLVVDDVWRCFDRLRDAVVAVATSAG